LRLGWNAEIGGSSSDITSGTGEADPFARKGKVEREYTLSYGTKFRLTDQNGWVPRSVLIVQGFTPTGGSEGTSTATSFIATYAAGWVFPNRWQLDTSMRYGLDSESGNRFSEWAPSAVLRVPLGEKLAVHIEYFGAFTCGKEENTVKHYISPGMRYLVTPELEIGARVGWGLNEQSSRFFSNVGFGWRF
jgi:Putative MetA-pathway of phenol degradation